jgi:hypothetical protein
MAYTKFFIVSVATTLELSPSVYALRKLSPETSTVSRPASSRLSRPVKSDSGIGATVSGRAWLR